MSWILGPFFTIKPSFLPCSTWSLHRRPIDARSPQLRFKGSVAWQKVTATVASRRGSAGCCKTWLLLLAFGWRCARKHISAAMAVLSPTSIAKKEKKACVGPAWYTWYTFRFGEFWWLNPDLCSTWRFTLAVSFGYG